MSMSPEEIKAWRDEHGLSQSQLARLLPVNIDTLQNWEIGRREPPAYLPRALADVERELAEHRPL